MSNVVVVPPELDRDRPLLTPFRVTIRARRPLGSAPWTSIFPAEQLAARIGIQLQVDDVGYSADFGIVADDQDDAVVIARRRWFYLATDLELPLWPITDVVVASPDL